MSDKFKKNKAQELNEAAYTVPNHRGYWVLGVLGAVAVVLGGVLFSNYVLSAKFITESLNTRSKEASSLTLDQCAQKNVEWARTCQALGNMCDDTVPRMMKICLVSAVDTGKRCAAYGNEIYGYNFGASECAPYMVKGSQNRKLKRACADTWQAVADYCKAVANADKQ